MTEWENLTKMMTSPNPFLGHTDDICCPQCRGPVDEDGTCPKCEPDCTLGT